MKQIIVTVGREHGSGGKYIAEQIAKQLGIAFYDKELLLASVFNAEDAARYDEKPVHLLWSRRIGENFNAPEDALAHETFEHIQELADSGESFVVLGRCSDYVLRANPNAVHLFIAGKPDQKRQRLMKEKSLTADQAALEIRRIDRDRKAYHNYYCDTKWGDARGYDLVVNSGKLGMPIRRRTNKHENAPDALAPGAFSVFHPPVFCGQQDTTIPARISAPPSWPAMPKCS